MIPFTWIPEIKTRNYFENLTWTNKSLPRIIICATKTLN